MKQKKSNNGIECAGAVLSLGSLLDSETSYQNSGVAELCSSRLDWGDVFVDPPEEKCNDLFPKGFKFDLSGKFRNRFI